MSKCVVAEFQNNVEAKVALEVLETDGFTLEQVSVVSSTTDPSASRLHDLDEERHHRENVEPANDEHNTGLGMLIGGSVAAPIAAGTLIGPFIVAGPLVGMAIGAAVGSLLGSTKKWGVDKDLSQDYEQRVKAGSVLIIVNDEDDVRLKEAYRLLQTADPKSIERFDVEQES